MIEESYKYLIKQPMDSVSEENVAKILSDKANKVKDMRSTITILAGVTFKNFSIIGVYIIILIWSYIYVNEGV